MTRGGSKRREEQRVTLDLPKGVTRVVSRGREYWYYQPGRGTKSEGKRERIPGYPEREEFWAAIRRIRNNQPASRRTLADAVRDWVPTLEKKAPSTKRLYVRHVYQLSEVLGEVPIEEVEPAELARVVDEYADRPPTANMILTVARLVFEREVRAGHVLINPARKIERIPHKAKGAIPWPEWALTLWEQMARPELRVAVALARYTGQRTSDVVCMTLGNFTGGRIKITQQKTGKTLSIPVHPKLEQMIAEARAEGRSALVPRPNGQPHSPHSFRSLYYRELTLDWAAPIRDAGLSMHGLRALAVCELLEVDCAPAEVSSITGMSMLMVERYGRERNQRVLADAAMAKWTSDPLTLPTGDS